MKFLSEIFKKHPFLLSINVVLLLLVNIVSVASFLSVAPIADIILHPDLQNISEITQKATEILNAFKLPISVFSLLCIFLGFQVFKSVFQIFVRYSILKIRAVVITGMVLDTFEDFYRSRWLFFSSNSQGTLLNTFMREMNTAGSAFGMMGLFLANMLQIPFYLAVPFYISWEITVISLIAGLLLATPFLFLSKLNYRLGKMHTTTANEVTGVLQESLMYAKVIIGFGNQRKALERIKHAFSENIRIGLKSDTLEIATPMMYEPMGVLIVIIAVVQAQNFGVSLAETAVLLWALRSTVPLVGNLVAQRNSVVRFFPSYAQVENLRKQAQEFKQEFGRRKFTAFTNAIRIKELTFAYPGNDFALKNIDCLIPKGRMVAFVGPSGAGKSTLIDLILGLNKPQTGQILFDGVPLQDFDIDSYHQKVGYVPQDSILFNITIRENLLWAKEDATYGEIREACQQANADEFIQELSRGYDTVVGDKGVRLSGGQCQRIALARAILRKPELLVLDEATSSLDTRSERLIQNAIDSIAKETTVIVIAHRLSTIVNADYVYVFEKGKIVEEGTYQELVVLDGHFSRMVKLQLLDTVVESS